MPKKKKATEQAPKTPEVVGEDFVIVTENPDGLPARNKPYGLFHKIDEITTDHVVNFSIEYEEKHAELRQILDQRKKDLDAVTRHVNRQNKSFRKYWSEKLNESIDAIFNGEKK